MNKHQTLIASITCCALSACATDPYATTHRARFGDYERYEPSLVQLARMRHLNSNTDQPITASQDGYVVADIDVINYTDHVKAILRTKFTNARFARYTSATAQTVLAAASGIAAAFSAGTTAIATLAFSSAAVPQIGEIFNAKARAIVYQDAVAKIEDAEAAYYRLHPRPSSKTFTVDAETLYKNVTGNIHTVESAIAGAVPDLKAVKAAETKPGTTAGSTTTQ